MRRLVVSLLVGALCLATVAPPGQVWAQEPAMEQTEIQAQPWKRDLTPYVVGFGAVIGVIAFNIAAPPVAAWGASTVRAVRNIGSVVSAARTRLAGGVVRPPVVAATASAGATTRAAGPLVPPLTQSMLAQAQIAAAAAGAAGAVTVSYAYDLVNWATGAAP